MFSRSRNLILAVFLTSAQRALPCTRARTYKTGYSTVFGQFPSNLNIQESDFGRIFNLRSTRVTVHALRNKKKQSIRRFLAIFLTYDSVIIILGVHAHKKHTIPWYIPVSGETFVFFISISLVAMPLYLIYNAL